MSAVFPTAYEQKAALYADPDECYKYENEPFIEGHIYLRSMHGFPERPVKLLKKYPTWLLVETVPMPVVQASEDLTKPFTMGVTSADLIRDVTDCLDVTVARLLNKECWQDDGKYRAERNRRYRFKGVDCGVSAARKRGAPEGISEEYSFETYDPEGANVG